jgi:hypothetical protein
VVKFRRQSSCSHFKSLISDSRQSSGQIEKVKVKVKFTLEQATKAQRGSKGKFYSFFNLGTRLGGSSGQMMMMMMMMIIIIIIIIESIVPLGT